MRHGEEFLKRITNTIIHTCNEKYNSTKLERSIENIIITYYLSSASSSDEMSIANPLFPRDRKRYASEISEITFLQIERLREII